MRLKLKLSSNKHLRTKDQQDMFTRLINITKNRNIHQEMSGENFFSFKNNNNEKLNMININNYSDLEYNTIYKQKNKIKKVIRSASLIKTRNKEKNEEIKSPNFIHSIRHIRQIVSMMEKKFNSLNDTSKDNMSNINYFPSVFNQSNQLTRNPLTINKDKIFIDKNQNDIKKNIELIPYPFKRLQKKIRKYFALSKIKLKQKKIKLSEEKINNFSLDNKSLLKIRRINNEHKLFEKNKEICNNYRNKITKINLLEAGNTFKQDKSVSTDNFFFRRNYIEKKKNNSLFNNKLLAYITNSENNFFLTNAEKNKKNEIERNLLMYHENY